MYPFSDMEEFVQALYQYGDLGRKPSYRRMMEAFNVDLSFNAPITCIDGDVILIARGTPAEEWENVGHELGHFFRDHGDVADLPPLYRHYIEHKADHFGYHFCVPSFMLLQDDLPFCRIEAMQTIMMRYGVTKRFAQHRLEMHERKLLEYHYF